MHFRWNEAHEHWGMVLTEHRWKSRSSSLPKELSDSHVELVLLPADIFDRSPSTDAELEQVAWFQRHRDAVSQVVANAIPDWRATYCEDGYADPVPATEVNNKLCLDTIFIHRMPNAGLPYIGYHFECDWDVEHGVGVLLHGTRLVEIGHADTAFEPWIAKADFARKG